jgi:hypothetical protein
MQGRTGYLGPKGPLPSANSPGLLHALGLLLLTLWCGWWGWSLYTNRLALGHYTWVDSWPFLGLDFLNNYHASRQWFAGGDPYVNLLGDVAPRRYCYPPLMLPCFFWCTWLSARAATVVWTIASALLAAVGVWWTARSRRELAVHPVPVPLLLSCLLFSAPLVFALERGNCDLLLVPLLVTAGWALRERSAPRDALAGACLALAAGLKIYPAILLAGLLPLRRWRALAFGMSAAAGLALYRVYDLPLFWHHLQEMIASSMPAALGGIGATCHTLSGTWPLLWKGDNLAWLRNLPGTAGALILVLPAVLFLSYRLYRRHSPERHIYPYLLWLVSAASFVPQVSNDYNLFFLLLAAMAAWDRRDRVVVHLGMALFILWAQPVHLAIGARLLLAFKLASLYTVGLSLLARSHEQVQASASEPYSTARMPIQTAAAA